MPFWYIVEFAVGMYRSKVCLVLILCTCELLVYTYTWWQIPHLYDLWNVNKWMNEWTEIGLYV